MGQSDSVDQKYKWFLYDLGPILKERALENKGLRDASAEGTGEREYLNGIMMGFHEVISLLQLQADAFQIDRAELRLEDIDPDRDLL